MATYSLDQQHELRKRGQLGLPILLNRVLTKIEAGDVAFDADVMSLFSLLERDLASVQENLDAAEGEIDVFEDIDDLSDEVSALEDTVSGLEDFVSELAILSREVGATKITAAISAFNAPSSEAA